MATRPVSAMSRQESEMVNKMRRTLADGREKEPIDKLRLLCLARGASGILGMGRAFRVMDDDGSKTLSLDEFATGIRDAGLNVDDEEAQEIFNQFDTDGSGTLNMDEFIMALRPNMSESRKKIVEQAFSKLDKTGDGFITIDDLK